MKKIIFAMIETGGGHKAPAKAIMEALRQNFPDQYNVRMIDFFKEIGCEKINRSLTLSWNFLLIHPLLTHILYQIQNSFGAISRAVMYQMFVAPAVQKTILFLKREHPDAVFSTHYLDTEALVEARKRSGLSFEIFTYQTEIFTYHSAWKVPGTDWYITSSQKAEREAARGGIPAWKIRTFPYPIHPDFLNSRRPLQMIAQELGLDREQNTVLFSFGNQGASTVIQYLLAMELFGTALNVIVATGRNTELKRRIDALKRHFQRINIISLGFSNNMNELISVADVCFIKPGPATTLECMHSKKAIIFCMAATPCEREHANFAIARGVAKDAGNSVTLFSAALKHFLKKETIQRVAERYNSIQLPNGAPYIAAFVDSTFQMRK